MTGGRTKHLAAGQPNTLRRDGHAQAICWRIRDPQGKQQIIHFDYKKALKTGNMQGIELVPGDTVVVPE